MHGVRRPPPEKRSSFRTHGTIQQVGWPMIGRVVRWCAVALLAGWAAVRVAGLDAWYPAVQLLAFTPYAALAGLVAAPALWLRRHWPEAIVAAVAAAALVGCVVPRTVPDPDPLAGADGPPLRVATANLLAGGADPVEIVRIVREQRVDVLAVQEMTPEWLAAADAAGIGMLLPRRHAAPADGTEGSAIFSRYPLRGGGSHLMAVGWFRQAYAVVMLPDGTSVAVESAHAASPYDAQTVPPWRRTLRAQPPAGAGTAPPRVLLGDFNATLDHHLLRRLIATGYRDAADVVGVGLVGTWGPYDGDPIPPVTLDHVLADRRLGVRDVRAYPITGSDHRMVVAELVLP